MNKDYTLADLLRSLHSLWTYTWCSSEFNKANTTAIRKKQYSQLQSHSHFHSHLHSQLEQVEQEKLHYDWALECPLQQVDKFKDKTRKIGEILETKFIDTARTATGNSMDDMVFQYNNQNSIYVLNANYSSYEIPHFGVINTAEQQQTTTTTANNNNNSNNRSSSKFQKIEDTAKSLQQKLKILEKEHFYDIATDAIGNPITSLMSSATSATAATAVIQKLINCSNNVDNTFTNDNSRSNNNSTEKSKDSKKGTFANVGRNAIASCSPTSNNKLSTVMSSSSSSSASAGCASSGGSNGKKKFNSIKPTLIAKKTKFWKFLEEEKARSQEQDISNGNLTRTSNCEQCMSTTCQNNTNGAAQSPHNGSANNESLSRSRGSRIEASPEANEPQHHRQQQQQKVNNWSGNHDSSNNQPKQQQRSSYELYKEAAELLGLSCTLCDNCRCLDCQSGYFDCDDSDSYSDFSIPDDYEYGYEETLPVTAHEMALIMHANAENECGMMDGVATFAVSQTPSRTNTVDITSANYVRGDGGEGGEAAAGAEVVGGPPTNAGDMHVNMGGVCYCRNGKCMEPHTNELHSTDNSSRGFNITSVHAQTVSRQDNDEISSSSSSMNSTLLERSPSSRAVINTVNSLTREDSQRERVREQQQQQQQQQQEQEKPCEHCSHFSHQREEHQYPKHQPEGNEAKNCASLNNLNVPATKGNGSASSHQRQSNCKN